MKRSEQYDKITPALFAAKAAIGLLPLVKDARGVNAKYIQLETLLAGLEPPLAENQLIITQGTTDKVTDGVLVAVTVETTVLHISGQWMSQEVVIPVSGPQLGKGEGGGRGPVGAQDGGISLTYARRYGLFLFFSLSIDKDTDGAAVRQVRRERAQRVASNLIDATAQRTEALKDKVAKLVTAPEGCPTCKAAQGTPHKKRCTDG